MPPRERDAPARAAGSTGTIPFAPPEIGDDEIAEVVAAMRSGWLTTGPRVRRFEEEFAAFVGAPEALALNSCSAGLHTALHVSGIGPGDAVVTTPVTFAATAHAIEHAGARPVFADVEPDTLNLSPTAVADAIGRAAKDGLRPRAILAVHYAGHPCDLDGLGALAEDHGLALVEDAAHALPAMFRGRRIGAPAPRPGVRSFVSFSFYANKNLTTGDGGMLIAPPEAMSAARAFCHHGIAHENGWRRDNARGAWRYEIVDAGFKYGMTDLAAAIGIHQLRRLEAADVRRREIAARYAQAFDGADAIELPVERPGCRTSWHLYPVRLRIDRLRIDRERVLGELDARGVCASVHFLPVHAQPWYRDRYGHRPSDFPVAWNAWPRLLSLPIHTRLSDADVDRVAGALLDICRTHRR